MTLNRQIGQLSAFQTPGRKLTIGADAEDAEGVTVIDSFALNAELRLRPRTRPATASKERGRFIDSPSRWLGDIRDKRHSMHGHKRSLCHPASTSRKTAEKVTKRSFFPMRSVAIRRFNEISPEFSSFRRESQIKRLIYSHEGLEFFSRSGSVRSTVKPSSLDATSDPVAK